MKSKKSPPPESDLERIARAIKPEQAKSMVATLYQLPQAALLLDSNYQFFMATRKAEIMLGYNSDQIRMDYLRFKPRVFKHLEEICRTHFDKNGQKRINLKGIAYSSSDQKHHFLLNLRLEKHDHEGAIAYLRKVVRKPYEKRKTDPVPIIAPPFVDGRADDFLKKLEVTYLSNKRIIIDLAKTREIIPDIADDLIKTAKEESRLIFLNPQPEVLEQLYDQGRGVPASKLAYTEPEYPPPKDLAPEPV